MQKLCKGCDKTKLFKDFHLRQRHDTYPNTVAGYSDKCKKCTLIDRKAAKIKNPKKIADIDTNSRLKRMYGITLTQYNQLFSAQNGCCKTCERPAGDFKKVLVVDHCHTTKLVRGLLCMPCNLTLGYVQDNTKVLENLIGYLNNTTSYLTPQKAG